MSVLTALTGKSTTKKASWTQEEDQVLYHTVLIHGAQDWGYIASLLTDKNAKQARERWHHHINYNLKKEEFTREEDKVIMQTHMHVGNQWTYISKLLSGRSDNDIKNRFYVIQRSLKNGKMAMVRNSNNEIQEIIYVKKNKKRKIETVNDIAETNFMRKSVPNEDNENMTLQDLALTSTEAVSLNILPTSPSKCLERMSYCPYIGEEFKSPKTSSQHDAHMNSIHRAHYGIESPNNYIGSFLEPKRESGYFDSDSYSNESYLFPFSSSLSSAYPNIRY